MPEDARPLSIVILTQDEATNLPACLESLGDLPADVFVVDSGSRDATVEIARAAGCQVVEHPFEDYASQRNWSFDNLPLRSPWTLCVDADERLTPALADEIRRVVSDPDSGPDGYRMKRRTVFMGRWLRHGGQYPTWHLRLFRTGRARCEARRYDQHFVLDGAAGALEHDLVDVLASDLTAWTARHNRWSSLEAQDLVAGEVARAAGPSVAPDAFGDPIARRRFLRERVYGRAPLFARAFAYWFYGYVVRLGFLDGVPGLVFHALQRFWFRFLVDAKVWEMRRRSAGGSELPLYWRPERRERNDR